MKIDIDKLTESELIDLNHRVVARLRFLHELRAHTEMLEFRIGDRVTFEPPGRRPLHGILARYNKKTVTVITDDGGQWNVSPHYLKKVVSQSTKYRGVQCDPDRQTLTDLTRSPAPLKTGDSVAVFLRYSGPWCGLLRRLTAELARCISRRLHTLNFHHFRDGTRPGFSQLLASEPPRPAPVPRSTPRAYRPRPRSAGFECRAALPSLQRVPDACRESRYHGSSRQCA